MMRHALQSGRRAAAAFAVAIGALLSATACQNRATGPTPAIEGGGKSSYLGLPGELEPSTPGYLAQSQGIDQGQYVFPPSVTVKGGIRYWFYSSWKAGSVGPFDPITGFSEDSYDGGDMYIAPELTGFSPLPFRKAAASWRVISPGPPIAYYIPPPGTYIDANFKLMGAAVQ